MSVSGETVRRRDDPADIGQHISRLHEATKSCTDLALAEHSTDLGLVHLLDSDLDDWIRRVVGPEADQLRAARRELALAEYAVAAGLYRQAFASLRLFLELSFAAVHFSVNEFERRRWNSDRADFSWSRALDEADGLLSKPFVAEFAPGVAGACSKYARDAAATYRYCSQFVHGKASASALLPDKIEYRSEVVAAWCEHAIQSGEAVILLMFVRYGQEFEAVSDTALSEILIQRFGRISVIRDLLGLANA